MAADDDDSRTFPDKLLDIALKTSKNGLRIRLGESITSQNQETS